MFSENLRMLRKARGLSQQDLAVKLHVVRQTVSKWEQGLSVPDAELLLSVSEVLETSVGTLLGENIREAEEDERRTIKEASDGLTVHLAAERQRKTRILCGILVGVSALIVLIFVMLIVLHSPYLDWDYTDPETAVAGTLLHASEWLFVRTGPVILAGAVFALFLLAGKKRHASLRQK